MGDKEWNLVRNLVMEGYLVTKRNYWTKEAHPAIINLNYFEEWIVVECKCIYQWCPGSWGKWTKFGLLVPSQGFPNSSMWVTKDISETYIDKLNSVSARRKYTISAIVRPLWKMILPKSSSNMSTYNLSFYVDASHKVYSIIVNFFRTFNRPHLIRCSLSTHVCVSTSILMLEWKPSFVFSPLRVMSDSILWFHVPYIPALHYPFRFQTAPPPEIIIIILLFWDFFYILRTHIRGQAQILYSFCSPCSIDPVPYIWVFPKIYDRFLVFIWPSLTICYSTSKATGTHFISEAPACKGVFAKIAGGTG